MVLRSGRQTDGRRSALALQSRPRRDVVPLLPVIEIKRGSIGFAVGGNVSVGDRRGSSGPRIEAAGHSGRAA